MKILHCLLVLSLLCLPSFADKQFTRLADINPDTNVNNLNVQLNYESPTEKTNWIDKISQKAVVLGNQELVRDLAAPQICLQTVQELDPHTGKVIKIVQSPSAECLREINNARILTKTIDEYTRVINNDQKGARIIQGITSVLLAPLAYTLKK